jgi:hypothetical protein
MAWACIRLNFRAGATSATDDRVGSIVKWYPEDAQGDAPHSFGDDSCRMWWGWVRVPDIPEAAQRATMRCDRRNGNWTRRFYIDLATIENLAPPGQFRNWMRDTLDPQRSMSVGEIKQRTVPWSWVAQAFHDARTNAQATEATILAWDPEIATGPNFALAPAHEQGWYIPASIPDANFPDLASYHLWVDRADDPTQAPT